MCDELDWELGDMFANGLFAFPVYEQHAARRVVRYLLKRGVSDEEIASAIQGSTIDLHAWLNRRGKPMFGEWAMAWMNESREMYQGQQQQRRPVVYRNGSLNDSETYSREATPATDCSSSSSSSSSASSSGEEDDSNYFRSRPEADEESVSSSAFSAFSGSTADCRGRQIHSHSQTRILRHNDVITADSFISVSSYDVTKGLLVRDGLRTAMADLRIGPVGNSPSTDSGNVSDQCSCRSKSSSFRQDFDLAVNYLVKSVSRQQDPARDATCLLSKCKLSHCARRQNAS